MHLFKQSKSLLLATLALAVLLLGGCGAGSATEGIRSVTDAGVTHVKTEKVIGDENDKELGTNYTATFGKEYGSFEAKLDFDDQCAPKSMKVSAKNVAAFQGQQYATAAAVDIQTQLSDMYESIGQEAIPAISEIIMRYLNPAGAVTGGAAPPD